MRPLTRDKFLTPEELEHLKKFASDLKNRDHVLIQLAIATGARASELLAIRSKDLVEGKSAVYIYGLKGSRDRQLPIPKSLFHALKRLGDVPFAITYSRWHQIWENYAPNKKKFHSLRHTFAINLYKAKRDLILVQMALGHKDILNTMVYLEYVYSQEELEKKLSS